MSGLYFLILSILASTTINIVFKALAHYRVSKLQAIVVNYLVCFLTGWTLAGNPNLLSHLQADWFLASFGLGTLFIGIFMSMAMTTDKLGISVNAVASKMAVVIPLIVAFVYFNETLTPSLIAGILMALGSIYFISIKAELKLNRHYLIFPILVFIGSGIIDTSLKLIESSFGQDQPMDVISSTIFLGAFCTGLLVLLVKSIKQRAPWKASSLLGGILLGLPNYFSIYFLLKALASYSNQSAVVFAINNVGVVLLSTLMSIVIFREHISKKNRLGLALAILSIALIAYGKS